VWSVTKLAINLFVTSMVAWLIPVVVSGLFGNEWCRNKEEETNN